MSHNSKDPVGTIDALWSHHMPLPLQRGSRERKGNSPVDSTEQRTSNNGHPRRNSPWVTQFSSFSLSLSLFLSRTLLYPNHTVRKLKSLCKSFCVYPNRSWNLWPVLLARQSQGKSKANEVMDLIESHAIYPCTFKQLSLFLLWFSQGRKKKWLGKGESCRKLHLLCTCHL